MNLGELVKRLVIPKWSEFDGGDAEGIVLLEYETKEDWSAKKEEKSFQTEYIALLGIMHQIRGGRFDQIMDAAIQEYGFEPKEKYIRVYATAMQELTRLGFVEAMVDKPEGELTDHQIMEMARKAVFKVNYDKLDQVEVTSVLPNRLEGLEPAIYNYFPF